MVRKSISKYETKVTWGQGGLHSSGGLAHEGLKSLKCQNFVYLCVFICNKTFYHLFENPKPYKRSSPVNDFLQEYLPPATKLRQGNVFTPVCHSVHRRLSVSGPRGYLPGGCLPRGDLVDTPWADTPQADTPRQTSPPGQTPHLAETPSPAQCMLGYGQQSSYWNAFLLNSNSTVSVFLFPGLTTESCPDTSWIKSAW